MPTTEERFLLLKPSVPLDAVFKREWDEILQCHKEGHITQNRRNIALLRAEERAVLHFFLRIAVEVFEIKRVHKVREQTLATV